MTQAQKEFQKVIDWVDEKTMVSKAIEEQDYELYKYLKSPKYIDDLVLIQERFERYKVFFGFELADIVIDGLKNANSIDKILVDMDSYLNKNRTGKDVVYPYYLQIEQDSVNFTNIPSDEDVKVITDELYKNRYSELRVPLLLYKNDKNEITSYPTNILIGYVSKPIKHSDSSMYEAIIENDLVVLNKELNGL